VLWIRSKQTIMPIDHAEPAREAAQLAGKRSAVLGRSAVFVKVAFRSAKGRAFAERKPT
jgi:hypothetical protein